MRTPLLIVLFLSSFAALAQSPSLTSSNILSIGDTYTYHVADSNAANLDGVTGANVTWDYSTLKGYTNTLDENILDASTTAQASSFTSSSITDELQGNLMIYSSMTADSSFSQGYFFNDATLGDVVAKFSTDEMKLMQYPFTFGDQISDTHSGTMTVPGLVQLPLNYSGSIEVTADGYGTLLLGGNTYNNVLRVKTTENSLAQTIIAGDILLNRVQYFYYQPGSQNFPVLMHISLTVGTNSASVVYSKDLLPPLSVTNLSATTNINVYPNPVKDQMNISIDSKEAFNGRLSIRNILGQEIIRTNANINIGENQLELDASKLNAGVYLVNLTSGSSTITKKITVR